MKNISRVGGLLKLSLRLLLLLFALSCSLLAQAQDSLPAKAVEVKSPKVEEALRGSVNPRYKVLQWITPVYLQPGDAANGRPALRLWPGTKVYLREYIADGFLIDFTGANERYYLPAKSVQSLPIFVEI